MSSKRTFLDSGVLIAAARGVDDTALQALRILDDPDREFVSSIFVKLEVLPKAIYNGFKEEATFYQSFSRRMSNLGSASATRWQK